MRDRNAIAALLREAADVIEADDTIPVPHVSLQFMTPHQQVPQHDAFMASMALFPCDYAYSVSQPGAFLLARGEVAEGFTVIVSAKASGLPAFSAAVLRGEEGAAA